jgi:hypothetical protein
MGQSWEALSDMFVSDDSLAIQIPVWIGMRWR